MNSSVFHKRGGTAVGVWDFSIIIDVADAVLLHQCRRHINPTAPGLQKGRHDLSFCDTNRAPQLVWTQSRLFCFVRFCFVLCLPVCV
jgi:hypothetical protein